MSNQDFERQSWQTSQTDARMRSEEPQGIKESAKETFSKASETVRDAGERIKRAASESASGAQDSAKSLFNSQIASGADLAGHIANSFRIAADDLSRQSPMAAGFVRQVADKVDTFGNDLRGQTADQVFRTASDYTRRQPALVFGLAALAGFFALRTIKSAQPVISPSIQPEYEGR